MDDFLTSGKRHWVSPLTNLRECEEELRRIIERLSGDVPFLKEHLENLALTDHAFEDQDEMEDEMAKRAVASYTKFFESIKNEKKTSAIARRRALRSGDIKKEETIEEEIERDSEISSDEDEGENSPDATDALKEKKGDEWAESIRMLDYMLLANVHFVNEFEQATTPYLKPGSTLKVKEYIEHDKEPPMIDKMDVDHTEDDSADEFKTDDEDETEVPAITETNEAMARPGTSRQALIDRFVGDIKVKKMEKEQQLIVKTSASEENPEFKNFREYCFKVNNKKGKSYINKEIKKELKKQLNLIELDFKEKKNLFNYAKCMTDEDPIVERSVMKYGYMPLLAGPLSDKSLKSLGSLAMFKFVSEDIGNFQWKSLNVHEQMTNDQKVKQRIMTLKQKISYALNVEPDIIISVSVFKNVKYDDTIADEFALHPEPNLAFELEICGEDNLGSLREKIVCENDYICMKEVKDPFKFQLKEMEPFYAKNTHTHFSFFIENNFYLNPECEGSAQYASEVIEWLKKPGHWSSLKKDYGIKNAYETKIKDLVISFGKPYLFTHLGDCEHLMVFNQAILKSQINPPMSEYPLYTKMGHYKVLNCRVDNEIMARWAVVGSIRFPEDPMLLCDHCLESFCYNKKKQRIGEFKLFPLIHLAHQL